MWSVRARPISLVRRDQLEAILAWLPDGPYLRVDHALFAAGGFAGLRLGELLELRWRQVDWIDQRIVAPGRTVPLHDRVGQALDRLSDVSEAPEQLVFRDPVTGGALTRRRVLARLREACVRAGVPPPRAFDDLRTGFAVACAEAGVPLDEIARWLGVRFRAVEWVAAFTPHANPAHTIQHVFGAFE
jgi:integrase